MRRLAALLLLALAPFSPAAAQSPPVLGSGDLSNGTVTATGSPASRSLAARAADGVNIKDFGAICDDVADDTAAINAAFNYVRANQTPVGAAYGKVVFPQSKACRINGPINLTMFSAIGLTIDGAGATIDCHVAGGVCLDALGARYLRVHDLTIIGSLVDVPKIGFQIGRTNIDSISTTGTHGFHDIFINGSFSLANFYNFSAELSLWENVHLYNTNAGAGSFALIQDGYNHFGATSTFVTNLAPVDQAQSFNENTFIGLDVRATGGGKTAWFGGTSRHRLIGSYSATSVGTGAFVLYTIPGSNNSMFYADVHFETASLTDAFLISGTNTAPVLHGFTYRDHNTYATNSVLKADAGVNSVTMRDAEINIGFYTGAGKLLDTTAHAASIWTFTGSYASPAMTQFNATSWQGPISTGVTRAGLASYGTGAISAQVPDSTVVGGAVRGNNSVDWQTVRGGVNLAATGANSVIIGGAENQVQGQYGIAGGLGNFANGTGALALGSNNALTANYSAAPGGFGANDHGITGAYLATGTFAVSGDAQQGSFVLRRQTSTAAAVQLTGNGAAANPNNCANLPNNSAYAFKVDVIALDHTTIANNASWNGWTGLLTRGANPGLTFIKTNTKPTPLTNGTVAGADLAITADTSSGCLNVTFTPPTANANTWNVVARVDVVMVQ